MVTLEQIAPSNASLFKATRLRALHESPLAFGSTYAKESQLCDEDWLKRATQWTSPRSIGYLAMSGNEPCGIAASFLDESDPRTAHFVSMWVDPAYRKKGIGRLLIDAIRKWAAGKGALRMRLSVTSSNVLAIKFYETNGFAKTGQTEPYPNDPNLFEHEMISWALVPSSP
jgi:ribosomal protein S18 acetylase RimI-like enzyme